MSRPLVYSFPPVADDRARVLILGSMPGVLSLAENQYYAHPRNLFWPIMGSLFGAGRDVAYEQRLRLLQDHRIALWDVLHSCQRDGSLDSDIQCEVANNFATFFNTYPQITHVFFNGGKAESSFRKHVRDVGQGLVMTRLPSTSPAHASLSFEEKTGRAWSQIRI
jgi:TDG/mug DNA glycosylase family protein